MVFLPLVHTKSNLKQTLLFLLYNLNDNAFIFLMAMQIEHCTIPDIHFHSYLLFWVEKGIHFSAEVWLDVGHSVDNDIDLEVVHRLSRNRIGSANHHLVHVATCQD